MSGLEKVGIPGPVHLREALTNCTDPLTAIEEFQLQNGILLPSLRPSLPFLDLHGVQRYEFHQSIMEDLRDRLLARIAELASSKDKNRNKILQDLLAKSFPVVEVKALRPVVLSIMRHLPKIKQEYLTTIMEQKELYAEASVEVKQQIWQDNQSLFGDEVSPLLSKYIDDRENLLFSLEQPQPLFFQLSTKARRQDDVVQQLAKMVGKNIKLYDMVLQFLRTLFLRTRNVHYCTLRAELLMALHDADAHEIVTVDPCHKFAWCLDACIRERIIDSKRARELQGFLDSLRRGAEQVLGDLSMILCDPHAIHTLAMSAMRALQMTANAESLPRETAIITRLLPAVISMMMDDQLQALLVKQPDEALSQLDPIPPFVVNISNENTMATTMTVYYTILVSRQKDVVGLMRVLPVLAGCDADTVYCDTTLHLIVSSLAQLPDSFSNTQFCHIVFQQFLLPMMSRENVLRHLLRLLWWVHHKVAPQLLDNLIELLKPNKQNSEVVHEVYKSLCEKISNYQPSPVASPEKLDSPLMSVPAPTPAHP